MSEQKEFQCLMIGLPQTGKSTFLAALWHVVSTKEIADSMKLVRREGSQAYLNQLVGNWSKCEQLERTPGEGESGIAVLLSHSSNDSYVRLEIPDTSGEMYQSHWEFRQCSEEYAILSRNCDGCLLFVHPETLIEPNFLVDANAIYDDWADDAVEAQSPEAPDQESVTAPEITPWEPKKAPTQVQLIEVLQDLTQLSKRRMKIAVIVSAWDVVGDGISPPKWIEKRLPMFWQYLHTNTSLYEFEFFGVSAQGGANADADRLLDHHDASKRIRVQYAGYSGSDITVPIQWLISCPMPDDLVR